MPALLPCCLGALLRQVVAMAAGDSAAVQAAVRQAMGQTRRKGRDWHFTTNKQDLSSEKNGNETTRSEFQQQELAYFMIFILYI